MKLSILSTHCRVQKPELFWNREANKAIGMPREKSCPNSESKAKREGSWREISMQ